MSQSLTSRSITVSLVTLSQTNRKSVRSARWAMFANEPVERSSIAVTSAPRTIRCSARWLPMNPAPPVISARRGWGKAGSCPVPFPLPFALWFPLPLALPFPFPFSVPFPSKRMRTSRFTAASTVSRERGSTSGGRRSSILSGSATRCRSWRANCPAAAILGCLLPVRSASVRMTGWSTSDSSYLPLSQRSWTSSAPWASGSPRNFSWSSWITWETSLRRRRSSGRSGRPFRTPVSTRSWGPGRCPWSRETRTWTGS